MVTGFRGEATLSNVNAYRRCVGNGKRLKIDFGIRYEDIVVIEYLIL